MRLFHGSVVVAIIACTISLPAAAQLPPNGGTGLSRRGHYAISGAVRVVDGSRTPESIQVKLWTRSASVAASTFTGSNGAFSFSDVPGGTYYLVVEEKGYQRIQEEVNLASQVSIDIQLSLTRESSYPYEKVGDGPTVSVRELAIPRRAREAMERGLELMGKKSDYKGSLVEFQRAVREYPDYYEAYLQMGIAYMRMDDTAKAEQMLNASIMMSQHKFPDALFSLASLYSNEKRSADAEPLAREAVQLNPDAWEAHQELARALHGLGQEEAAEASALEAIRIQPDYPQIYLILANIHLKLSSYPALVRDLDQYLKLQPDGPQADQARQMRQQVVEHLGSTPPQTPQP